MNIIKCKQCEKQLGVWVEDRAACKQLVDHRNAAHPVPADHLSKHRWESRRGGREMGREEIHCMKHIKKSSRY